MFTEKNEETSLVPDRLFASAPSLSHWTVYSRVLAERRKHARARIHIAIEREGEERGSFVLCSSYSHSIALVVAVAVDWCCSQSFAVRPRFE